MRSQRWERRCKVGTNGQGDGASQKDRRREGESAARAAPRANTEPREVPERLLDAVGDGEA